MYTFCFILSLFFTEGDGIDMRYYGFLDAKGGIFRFAFTCCAIETTLEGIFF